MRHFCILISVVTSLLLGVAGTSNATPDLTVSHWSCSGQACLKIVPSVVSPGATPRDANGCNRKVCIYVVGTAAGGYSTAGQGSGFYGHIHIWGPHLNLNGPTSANPSASGNGWGSGQTCAEGWAPIGDGRYQSMGRPCEYVS